jgi:transcription initiation factor TFIID subunit TAF12
LFQSNNNDVLFGANDQFNVASQKFTASARSGIVVQSAQGEIYANADNAIVATADTFQATAEKEIAITSQVCLVGEQQQQQQQQQQHNTSDCVLTCDYRFSSSRVALVLPRTSKLLFKRLKASISQLPTMP